LKTGGETYDHRYVNATANNIRNMVNYKHEIVCITDDAYGIDSVDRIIEMKHDWPKWWGKVEMFRSDITQNKHCLFLDLDTVCLSNIDFLCKLPPGFYGLEDFYLNHTFQTGILKWEVNDKTVEIYNKFTETDVSKYMHKGDHTWIGEHGPPKQFLQNVCPGKIASYKKHMNLITKNHVSPAVICFHGNPRPHAVQDKFITDFWKY
jgi:hypothetical protein